MLPHELEALFDQQAASYDQQWANLAPIRDGLNLLLGAVMANLPAEARILCVGAGTGAEILYLAERFPGFSFTAVEPSTLMLEECRRRAEAQGITSRCTFHRGYLESLPDTGFFHAATSLLVSHFILDPALRAGFFREIGERLLPGGTLVTADLAGDPGSEEYRRLLDVWIRLMRVHGMSLEMEERFRAMYQSDVAFVAPDRLAALLVASGFDSPIEFFQSGLIHAWFAATPSAPAG